jgi:hypothetical protein
MNDEVERIWNMRYFPSTCLGLRKIMKYLSGDLVSERNFKPDLTPKFGSILSYEVDLRTAA